MLKVNVKWGKERFSDIELDTSQPPLIFKAQIFTLTGVPPERQKIMGVKGGVLKDDAEWSKLNIKENHNFMMMGTAITLKEPEEKVVFVEDLTADETEQMEALYPAGLTNLGNTCYLNSTLQCLKNVPELIDSMKQMNPNNEPQQQLVSSMRDVLLGLQNSVSAVTPFEFLHRFRELYPQFAQRGEGGHYTQQDAEEAWTQLMQTLKSCPDLPMEKLFQGETVFEMKNLDAPEEEHTGGEDNFNKLQCHISSTTNHLFDGLEQGLTEVVEKNSELLGREANYEKTQKISKLPFYLPIQFVRFFWKKAAETKAKILRPVSFPFKLDVYDLCTDELKAKLDVRRKQLDEAETARLQNLKSDGLGGFVDEKKDGEKNDDNKDEDENEKKKKETESKKNEEPEKMEVDTSPETNLTLDADLPALTNLTGTYELCGIVSHQGRSADGGHYIGWLKESDNKWLKFDDDRVSVVDDEQIKSLNGTGGSDWHIAYLCIYRSLNH